MATTKSAWRDFTDALENASSTTCDLRYRESRYRPWYPRQIAWLEYATWSEITALRTTSSMCVNGTGSASRALCRCWRLIIGNHGWVSLNQRSTKVCKYACGNVIKSATAASDSAWLRF